MLQVFSRRRAGAGALLLFLAGLLPGCTPNETSHPRPGSSPPAKQPGGDGKAVKPPEKDPG